MKKEIPGKLPSKLEHITEIVRQEQILLAGEQAELRRRLPRHNTSGKTIYVNI